MSSSKKAAEKQAKVIFTVKINKPHLHYYDVEMKVDLKQTATRLLLPNWTPGSYMIRSYSGNVHKLKAYNQKGIPIHVEQIDLSVWEISNQKKPFSVKYTVYAFENTARTNFLDTEFGFINPAALFLYPENMLDIRSEIHFELNSHFKYIYTPLSRKKDFFISANYDELFDSPFQLSNRSSDFFESAGCKHEIIIEGNLEKSIRDSILENLKIITEYQINQFGVNPNSYYLFILNLTDNSYGGLEHKACSVNIFDPFDLDKKSELNKLLGLLCHEYFHLWNVKRIRPIALGPFDYQNPVLTNELWIAEGVTSFYDNYFLLKTGIYTRDEYVSKIISDINKLEENWGDDWMSLEESSFTAWIKYYKQTPNYVNTGVSYYVKGSILVLCMNIFILEKTNLKFDFMEVMRALYKNYVQKKDRGFTKEEFFLTALEATGVDLRKEFEPYISEVKRIPVEKYLEKIGIKIAKTNKNGCLHFETRTQDGKEIIRNIRQKRHQFNDLSIGDEIIAINGIRANRDWIDKCNSQLEEGTEIVLLIARRGIVHERKIKCEYAYSYQREFQGAILEEILEKNSLARKFFEEEGVF
jgi:predicted metalloprotease with PDZ domain